MEKIKLIYPALTINLKPPVNLKPGEEKLFDNYPAPFSVNESYLKSFDNVLISDIGVPLKNYRLMKEFIACYDEDFTNYAWRYTLKVLIKSKKIKTDNTQTYFLIFDNYSGPNGFFHWIADGLTRLIEVHDIINNYTVIVPEYFRDNKFYMYTLSLFGIKNFLFIPEGTSLNVNKLLITDFIAVSGHFNPENTNKLSKFILEKIPEINSKPSANTRLYVSRKKAKRRYAINEDEVENVFKEFDFKIIYMEDLDFADQIKMAHDAEILASIHGGALTHIFFMRPDTNVFEFRKKGDAKNNCYYRLADAMNVNYYYQSCDAIEISNAANNFNLNVDLKELRMNIQLMLNNSNIKKN